MAGGKVLATDVHVYQDGQPVVLVAGSSVPSWAKDQVTNPKAFAAVVEAESEQSDETETGEKPYAERSKAELVDLLKERELPHTGNVAELAARLEQADKEAESEQSDETETEE